MWYDELHTFYIAREPTVAAAWQMVKDGVDLNPPLLYAAAHESGELFGFNEIGIRLPSVLAFMLAMVCLLGFLRRRVGFVFGMCGAMIPLVTKAYPYSFEARPYALVLAGSALALFSWQTATENRHRVLALAGITLGLGMALLSHGFAGIVLIPFVMGEAIRSFSRKRIDWLIWLALGASAPALVFYPVLIQHATAFGKKVPHMSSSLVDIPAYYIWLLTPVWVFLAVSILLAIAVWSHGSAPMKKLLSVFPHCEFVTLVGFALVPAFLVIFTTLRSSVFVFRYGLVGVIGLAAILSGFFYTRFRTDARLGMVALFALTMIFLGHFAAYAATKFDQIESRWKGRIEGVYGHPLLLQAANSNLPLVVSNGLLFLPVDYYSPPDLTARTFFLIDSATALRLTGTDLYDLSYPFLIKKFPIRGHLEAYSKFIADHDRFFVYYESRLEMEWVTGQLRSDGFELREAGRSGNKVLFMAKHSAVKNAPN